MIDKMEQDNIIERGKMDNIRGSNVVHARQKNYLNFSILLLTYRAALLAYVRWVLVPTISRGYRSYNII